MKIKKHIALATLAFVLLPCRVFATINLELTQGLAGALPIAIVPFKGQPETQKTGANIAYIIRQDLHNSGRFRDFAVNAMSHFPHAPSDIDPDYWRHQDIDTVVVGQVRRLIKGYVEVEVALVDLYPPQDKVHPTSEGKLILFKHRYRIKTSGMRRLAHHISDSIYKKLTGTPGVFSTHLAYVLVQQDQQGQKQYQLEISDVDGFNPKTLLLSKQPIMSPTWSPDGNAIAYVSFEGHRSAIFVQNIRSGQRHRIAAFPGVNGAPAWSPDGHSLALVLTQTGTPKLYRLDLRTHHLTQLTQGLSIDTEPVWSPDGRALLFTSDRGGSPQIYRLNLKTKQITRLTFDGHYNAHASYTANGRLIALLHKDEHLFSIAALDTKTGALTPLTPEGLHDSPCIAPNGSMIVYATRDTGRRVLNMVSIEGAVRLRLPAQQGDVQSPAWSPL